ncbi:HTH-type transcriptional activator RhaS [Hyphomicrobiales bacterium]|nr:HTH-type transcriptional activator RhaS [Hyphomicrobiales bacterium]CAH1698586.1 HTH-type transcriptional activator RhaS [Hyphomicrobiales bacterium]CAI0342233.1 HTH-type transcriptional activator RhaS [Hyphomicrobiales bacterium]
MPDINLLRRFTVLSAPDPEQFRNWLKPALSVHEFDTKHCERPSDGVLNHRASDNVSLTFARYGAAISARMQQNDSFLQGFPVSGAGEVRRGHESMTVSAAAGGVVLGPGSEASFAYDGSFAHLILRLSPEAVTRKLSALIGRPVDPQLRLDDGRRSLAHWAGQMRLVRFFAEELDREDGQLPPLALAEIEQAIIVAFLTGHPHNYSHWLTAAPAMIAPWQVRMAAEYMEQNWDKPITIEALCQITQTSARSLFHLFRRTYGVSPMVFVRRIRLQHAKAILSRPTPETSVTTVGFLCGFSNLGNFARAYFEAFGERPSNTLRANRPVWN